MAGTLLVIIPAYNEAPTVGEVVKAIPRSMPAVTQVTCIVIDDGSTDNTAQIAREAGAEIVSLGEHRGLGVAMRTALGLAVRRGAEYLATMDADAQFDPRDLPRLLQPIIENRADLATASRFADPALTPLHMPKIKIWGNRFVAWLISGLARKKFRDVSCGFRAYNREAILHLNLFGEFTYVHEMILDLSFKGLRIAEVPVAVRYFKNRQSRMAHNLFLYGVRILKIIFKTFRDYRPLQFFGVSGIVLFAAGITLDAFVGWHYLATGKFSPYRFLAFIGGFLNLLGFSLVILGLITDMLVRIRMNQEQLLYYAKRESHNHQ